MTLALLWDHDGVLVDTEGLYFQATREMMATVDVDLSRELYRKYLLVEGTGAWHLAEQRGVSPSEIEALRAQRNQRYAELLASGDVLVPGVLGVLAALGKQYRMAIVTSSHRGHFDTIHRSSGLPQYFELVLTREDYVHSKPSPEPYLMALVRMQLQPEQCLVIEDSERGLRAAKAAGLRCWVVPSALTQGSSFVGAERTFQDLTGVSEALRQQR